MVPLLAVTPLVFLGGAFYSISMLPPAWQTVSLFNPVVYLISGFRWSFLGLADVPVGLVAPCDHGVPDRLPRDGGVDLPQRLAAQTLSGRPFIFPKKKIRMAPSVAEETVGRVDDDPSGPRGRRWGRSRS